MGIGFILIPLFFTFLSVVVYAENVEDADSIKDSTKESPTEYHV